MSHFRKDRREKAGWPIWAAAIAALLFGLALVIWPGITAEVLLNVAGAALIVVGALNIVRYFIHKDPYNMLSWELGLGIALACAGLVLIAFKAALISIVPLIFGIALVIGGIVKIQAASNMHRMNAQRWFLPLIAAAASCILGVLIIAHPFGTGLTLMRVLGISIVIEAVEDMLSMHSYNKVIETFFVD